jgi:AraC family transcriptional regulator
MRATYVTDIPEAAVQPNVDAIHILLPGHQAIYEAILCLPNGRARTALLCGPYVTIVPPRYLRSIRGVRPSDLVVLALASRFYREKVRIAMGLNPPDVALDHTVDPFIRELSDAICSEFSSLDPPRRVSGTMYLKTVASVLAIHLANKYRYNGSTPGTRGGLPAQKFKCVLAFIGEHLAEAIAVSRLADTVHMSPGHFAHTFRHVVGQSPHSYITGQRMDRAKGLLRNSELPLVDVAANVGFQTQAHFTEVFHKHAGLTPRAYRLASRP